MPVWWSFQLCLVGSRARKFLTCFQHAGFARKLSPTPEPPSVFPILSRYRRSGAPLRISEKNDIPKMHKAREQKPGRKGKTISRLKQNKTTPGIVLPRKKRESVAPKKLSVWRDNGDGTCVLILLSIVTWYNISLIKSKLYPLLIRTPNNEQLKCCLSWYSGWQSRVRKGTQVGPGPRPTDGVLPTWHIPCFTMLSPWISCVPILLSIVYWNSISLMKPNLYPLLIRTPNNEHLKCRLGT